MAGANDGRNNKPGRWNKGEKPYSNLEFSCGYDGGKRFLSFWLVAIFQLIERYENGNRDYVVVTMIIAAGIDGR